MKSGAVKEIQAFILVLTSTSLQLIPAYSSQSPGFAQTLVRVGLKSAVEDVPT